MIEAERKKESRRILKRSSELWCFISQLIFWEILLFLFITGLELFFFFFLAEDSFLELLVCLFCKAFFPTLIAANETWLFFTESIELIVTVSFWETRKNLLEHDYVTSGCYILWRRTLVVVTISFSSFMLIGLASH